MEQPKVSVIMAVNRNRGKLQKTISSVLNQSFSNFEFVVIDDHSKDNTLSILNQIKIKDSRVKLIQNKMNLGLTRSLITGVNTAKGVYIARIDEGDVWHEKKLQVQAEFLDTHPDFVLVGSQYRDYFSNSNTKTKLSKLPISHSDMFKSLVRGVNPITHPAILFRNGTINYNPNAKLSQDFELCMRMVFIGKISNIDEYLVDVLREPNSISSKKRAIQYYFHLMIHKQFISALYNHKKQKQFKLNGVKFNKMPFLYSARKKYMQMIFDVSEKTNNKYLGKFLRVILLPDKLIYEIYRRILPVFIKTSSIKNAYENPSHN